MLMMTAKVDKKKILIGAGALVLAIVLLIALVGGSPESRETAAPVDAGGSNEERVKFLTDLDWEVTASPKESGQIRIPAESSEVYDRYNALQKSQGFDLSQFAGKTVMRYVYQIKNYPGTTEPVYATILVYRDKIIGGDITVSGPGGQVQGFQMPKAPSQP